MTGAAWRVLPERLQGALGRPLAFVLELAARWSRRQTGLALVYHRVDRRPRDPRRELVPAHSLALFEAQLQHLRARYRPVPASELVAAAAARRRGERFPVAVTFDDDLPSHVHLALPALRSAGVPATFFLNGASLERPFTFWWERLQQAIDRGLPVDALLAEAGAGPAGSSGPDTTIHELALGLQTQPAERKAAVAARLLEALGDEPPDAGLREAQVRTLGEAECEVGFHTRRHHFLPGLDDEALAVALGEGRDELAAAVGRDLSLLAYPHGGGDRRVAAAARAAGYRLAFTTRPGPVGPGSDPHLLGRIEPDFRALPHFELQLARGLWRPPGDA